MSEVKNYFDFTNEGINEYLVDYVLSKRVDISDRIRFLTDDGDEIAPSGDGKIDFVVFDGTDEDLFVNFFVDHVSVFVKDKELMFIDESNIDSYTSSDVYNNVVYEGRIVDTDHQSFLGKLAEIVLCFVDANDLAVEESKDDDLDDHKYFEAHRYKITIEKNTGEHGEYEFGNISILY